MRLSSPSVHEPFMVTLILLACLERVTASVLHHYNGACRKTTVAVLLVCLDPIIPRETDLGS